MPTLRASNQSQSGFLPPRSRVTANQITTVTKKSAANQFSVRRVVIGVNYRFNESTKLVTELEFEFENGVTSTTDPGEVAIEQAYIDHQLNQKFSLRGGLFWVPMA